MNTNIDNLMQEPLASAQTYFDYAGDMKDGMNGKVATLDGYCVELKGRLRSGS